MQTIKYSRDHKKSPSPQVWILKMLHFFIESTVILTYIEHLNSNQRARGWKEVRIRNYLGKGKRKQRQADSCQAQYGGTSYGGPVERSASLTTGRKLSLSFNPVVLASTGFNFIVLPLTCYVARTLIIEKMNHFIGEKGKCSW